MATTTRPHWATRNGAGELAYGPEQAFTYDDGTPATVGTSWSPHDGADIHITTRNGVGISLTPGEAARLARALDRAVTAVTGWLSPRRWRTTIAAVAAVAAIVGGYGLAIASGRAASVPAYRIVAVDTAGFQRDVLVSVATTNHLRRVFGAVIDGLHEPAAYRVQLTCAATQVRLAHGTLARGTLGAQLTGIPQDGFRYVAVRGATCARAG